MDKQRSYRHNVVIPELHSLGADPRELEEAKQNPDDFFITITARIGPKGERGPKGEPAEDVFYFLVCSPKWLVHSLSEKPFVFGRHYLILNHYNYDKIWTIISSFCKQISGSTWTEVATKLARYGHWEFEDYREKE
jgi:hypothetical protein